MSARSRRRRVPRPARRIRRWLRAQDSFTRALLVAVVALSAVIVALIVPRFQGHTPDRRSARIASPVADGRVSAPSRPPARRPARETRKPPEPPQPPAPPRKPPVAAVTRKAEPPHPHPPPPQARIAIVIDDLGQRLSSLEQLAGLDMPLTIAVIPGLPASARTIREASRLGIEMLVHEPMEPHDEGGKNAGERVLLTSMTTDALRTMVRADIAAVPGAVGVNNHMGSKFTEDPAGLGVVMAEIRAKGLFWLDSRTTPSSRAMEVARGMGVPTIGRDVFLDAKVDAESIRSQIRKLVETAMARGTAVGIGHPHPETISALREMREELRASGVVLVPLIALVRPTPAQSPGQGALAAALTGSSHSGWAPSSLKANTP